MGQTTEETGTIA